MITVQFVLLLIALVVFIFAAIRHPFSKVDLVGTGFCLLVLVWLLDRWRPL